MTNQKPNRKPSHLKGKEAIRTGKHRLQTTSAPRQSSMVVTVRATVMGERKTYLTRIHRNRTLVMDRFIHEPDTIENVIVATKELAREQTASSRLYSGQPFSFDLCNIVGLRRASRKA
jgi:hypothetical protein